VEATRTVPTLPKTAIVVLTVAVDVGAEGVALEAEADAVDAMIVIAALASGMVQ
jgi:hypothetical protein